MFGLRGGLFYRKNNIEISHYDFIYILFINFILIWRKS